MCTQNYLDHILKVKASSRPYVIVLTMAMILSFISEDRNRISLKITDIICEPPVKCFGYNDGFLDISVKQLVEIIGS